MTAIIAFTLGWFAAEYISRSQGVSPFRILVEKVKAKWHEWRNK